MAISFVNRIQTGYPAATVSMVTNVPASTALDDLLLWIVSGSGIVAPTTPAGWTLTPQITATGLGLWVYHKWALATEAASYTMTVPTNRWAATMIAFRGVDTTTPFDATFTTAIGTTVIQPPAITTVTANAWVYDIDCGLAAVAATGTTWASSNTTLASTISATGTTGTLPTFGTGYVARPTTGAFTGAFTATSTGTFTRSAAIAMALRPLVVAPSGFTGWGVPM